MNKVRVIDLLNKIANGEEVPKKIRYDSNTYYYIEDNREGVCYIDTALDKENIWSHFLYNIDTLNDEVEVIEDKPKIMNDIRESCGLPRILEDKKIEKLDDYWEIGDNYQDSIKYINRNFENMYNKINETIDYLNKENK